MRVVAGEFGGRRLKAVPGMKTRPTTDKVKESMFNIIGPYLNGGNVLDLFGGSGGLSIEAVSRGADSATLIDRQYQAIKTINENIEVTKSKEKFRIIKGDTNKVIFKLAKESKFGCRFFFQLLFVVRLVERVASFNLLLVFLLQLFQPVVGD